MEPVCNVAIVGYPDGLTGFSALASNGRFSWSLIESGRRLDRIQLAHRAPLAVRHARSAAGAVNLIELDAAADATLVDDVAWDGFVVITDARAPVDPVVRRRIDALVALGARALAALVDGADTEQELARGIDALRLPNVPALVLPSDLWDATRWHLFEEHDQGQEPDEMQRERWLTRVKSIGDELEQLFGTLVPVTTRATGAVFSTYRGLVFRCRHCGEVLTPNLLAVDWADRTLPRPDRMLVEPALCTRAPAGFDLGLGDCWMLHPAMLVGTTLQSGRASVDCCGYGAYNGPNHTCPNGHLVASIWTGHSSGTFAAVWPEHVVATPAAELTVEQLERLHALIED